MCLTKSRESGKDCKGVASQKDLVANPCFTLSSLKTATAVERIFPFIPENL